MLAATLGPMIYPTPSNSGEISADTDAPLKKVSMRVGISAQSFVPAIEELVESADAESEKHGLGGGAALFADNQHVGAGGSFGIGELAVFLDDQSLPQGNHHQHTQHTAQAAT